MKLKKLFPIFFAAMAVTASAQGYKDGIEYFKADQFDNAKELLLRNLNNADTDVAASNYYLGRIALLENKTADAQKYFEKGLEANPEYAYNYVGIGEIELKAGDKKEAEENFKKADKLAEKKDAGVKVAIARAYYNVDPVTYAKEIEKNVINARKKDINSADLYIFEGDVAAAKQDWGEAAGKYDIAINFHPEASEGYVKYAILHKQINPDYTIQKLEELVNKMPNSALGQRELAKAYYDNKQYGEAADAYGKYVQNPNHFKQDEDQYAFLLFYSKEYKKGYDYATKLLAQNSNNFTARRFQFMNAAQLSEMKEQLLPMAEQLWNAHNDKNIFAPIDYILVSEEFQTAKRYEDSEKVLVEATKVMPNNDTFPKMLSNLYLNENKIAKSADAFAKYLAMQETPKYNDLIQQAVYYFYAAPEARENDVAAADEYLKKAANTAEIAIKQYPEQYRSYKIVGDVKIQQANDKTLGTKIALEDYKMAAEKLILVETPSKQALNDAKSIFAYIGNYYLNAGDKETAKKYFSEYLKLDPENTDFQQTINSL